MILKIILAALCANLLYTNANLMLAASSELATWQSWMMVVFAVTYSLISTLSIFKMQSLFAIVCFAILDGAAVFLHFADHGANFKMIVSVYFGIYTAYTLIVAFAIKRNEDADDNGNEVEGHDAAYWHKCFLYQKDRADNANRDNLKRFDDVEPTGNKMTPFEGVAENTTSADQFREVTKIIEDKPKELPDVGKEINAEHQDADISKTILSIKRAFNRMKDPDKRRERIKDLPEEVKNEIKKLYDL
jgi:hypothetical protein